ncbi:magnesium transporter NIPA-domain-containing protein [Talaromyces proteolyticus]|uniref:Magnesium transporter NIPA-domain-containing protein n=1 Tax=Talaromyces proteolyticus TaxID=1131652 RepID=A0AAD4KNQ2_9EURO|nr:magnesium transporter NIPA-domain-containing protein [Talaromyces proteolyticus]KAH8695950.1 magnesium transporter NIPA-domain-containing protein [Talaromyces proteolyticus]
MDQTAAALGHANALYARASSSQPPVYKAIGISLAISSGLFIGISFVLKKTGLLKANVKYNEEAGEGYGYLKNAWWWTGMTLMIIGEICNFVAYCFVDAILVTPMGALSVVVTTVLSAIFLKERLSFVGKIGCFNCIIGAVIIALNAPEQSSVSDIQAMQHYVISPGFLTYAGVIIAGCTFVALWAGPRYGKRSMFVYISICSLIGGLSVVATQGLGASILAQIRGESQFKHWFLYVLFAFVVASLLTEIIYLNKALNIFNAALVTPTYYVFFTSSTIVTSAVLFRGFSGSAMAIVTMVMGFLTICSGVVLLQLSKSAKDVPDAAIFKGDLDQIREVSEQEAPETEPKADAIRGAAAIIRRISVSRQKMEQDEFKRYVKEKQEDQLSVPGDNEVVEWDGIRRRKTVIGDHPIMTPKSSRSLRSPHPPLGMSYFPEERGEYVRTPSGNSSSFLGGARGRTSSILHPSQWRPRGDGEDDVQPSPMHPVALTEIALRDKEGTDTAYYGGKDAHLEPPFQPHLGRERSDTPRSIIWADERPDISPHRKTHLAPDDSPQARRQFSFRTMFNRKKSGESLSYSPASPSRGILKNTDRGPGSADVRRAMKNATEEERLGLVKGDSHNTNVEEDFQKEKLTRSSSPDSFDSTLDAVEEVRRQYARPHQPSGSSTISTSTFPPYEDVHHHYHSETDHPRGYLTVRRISSPPPIIEEDPAENQRGQPQRLLNTSISGPSKSLPPIPSSDEEYVQVERSSEGHSHSSPEIGVTSVASSSPPSTGRGYRRHPNTGGNRSAASSRSNSSGSEGSDGASRRLVSGGPAAFI